MNEAKIRLSAKEAELVLNADWILTKNEVVKKAKHLLEGVLEEQQKIIQPLPRHLPPEIGSVSPKISKGENYKGLPYLVLDHPRYFDKENVFAIRTLFWWGNFFSTTLHLSGSYKKKYEQTIVDAYPSLIKQDIHYCINDDPWEHHFEKSNYEAVAAFTPADLERSTREKDFIKLSKKISLREWDHANAKLANDFGVFIKMLEA